jgi:histidyl-tRNA synthetase
VADKITAPKGTYDILPEDQLVRRWVISRAEQVFARYGYGRLDTPMFEETRLFVRGVGESTDIVRKEMYTFDDLGGRSMTLRPEGTAPAARAYVEHGMHTRPQPVKLWYHWPMFRYESPQSGRYRQHYQLGVEAFGSNSPALDAEVIGVLAAVYREIGLKGVELRLNSMGDRQCRPEYVARLRGFLESKEAELCGDCVERTRLNPLRAFDCKVPGCQKVMHQAPRITDSLCPSCAEHHQRVLHHLEQQSISFSEDHTLVRGMDYYTRTTFEFTSSVLGAQSGVGGGGRYDNLVESIGGPDVPGVGFGTGVERILLALSRSEADLPAFAGPTAYVVALNEQARSEAFGLVHELRSSAVSAELDHLGRSLKGQMRQATSLKARFAAILGESELAEGTVTLKDLDSGEESKLPRNQAVARLVSAQEGS